MSQADESDSLDFTVTHRSVLAIAVPMTLAYLTTPLLGVTDLAVIGRLGDPALVGGIALGAIIFELVFTTFNFLRLSTTGFTAQAVGAGNTSDAIATLFRALAISAIAGFVVLTLQLPIKTGGMYFLGGSEAVQQATARYFDVRIYSTPFLLANYVILGWLVGLGHTGKGLALQFFMNGLNIVLSVLFVLGLGWSVEGAALATVISEVAAFVCGLAVVLVITGRFGWPRMRNVFERPAMWRMMAVNRDIMIRSFVLIFAFAYFAARSADQGDVILAANAILEKLLILAAFFLDGLATAAEQLAGRAVGARNRAAFDRMNRLTILWTFALSILLGAIYMVFGSVIIDGMTVSEDVRQACNTFLIWAALAPIAGALAFQMDGVFIGATWSREMRNMMLVSLGIYLLADQVLFPLLENHGLWLAFIIFLAFRGLSLSVICRKRADKVFA